MADAEGKESQEQEVTDADRASVEALDADFGEASFETESPDPEKDTSSEDTSGVKKDEGSEGKTDDEKAAEVQAAKETYDSSTPEEKAAIDKTVADKAEAEVKAAYEKLSPEEKKSADDTKAEKEVREVETKRIADDHSVVLSRSEKRRVDTERWAQGLNQEQLELKREILILQRKAADPDYDPEKDDSLKDVGPTEEEKAIRSEQKGRAGASLKASYATRGKEVTEALLAEYKEMFLEDRVVQQQVMASDVPVEEAIGLVKLSKFFTKYGQDPDAIITNVRKELTDELTPKIRVEENKKILADLKKTSSLPKTLSGVKGATDRQKTKGSSEGDGKSRSMEDDFG